MNTFNLDYQKAFTSTFDKFKQGIFDLNQNIKTLELELSDASKFVSNHNDYLDTEGINILEEIARKWTNLCEDLEDTIKQDEMEIDRLNQDLDMGKEIVVENEQKINELEHFLKEQKLLVPVENVSIGELEPN